MRFLFAVLLTLSACRREEYTARLATGDAITFVRAIKGNDVVVAKGAGLARIRLVGVYTFDPNVAEKNDIIVWAQRAAEMMSSRARSASLRVVLEREELDPRGRHLGFLEADGVDLGKLLVEEGQASVYTEYPFSRETDYLAAETRAREGVRGLWGGTSATKRIRALRDTWSTVRERKFGAAPNDPLLRGAP
jgi:endonuclease YncB( thermonuclease family)